MKNIVYKYSGNMPCTSACALLKGSYNIVAYLARNKMRLHDCSDFGAAVLLRFSLKVKSNLLCNTWNSNLQLGPEDKL